MTAEPTIYFVRAADGLIKIGWTAKGVHRRMAQLRTGAGPLELVAAAPGSQRTERALHQRLAVDRIPSTEWFRISVETALSLATELGGGAPTRPVLSAQTEREMWEAERVAMFAAAADADARADARAIRRRELSEATPGAVARILRAAAYDAPPLTRSALHAAADAAIACVESPGFHRNAYSEWRRRGGR